jgi:hypothetical protein
MEPRRSLAAKSCAKQGHLCGMIVLAECREISVEEEWRT